MATGQMCADALVFADHPCRLRHSPLAMARLRDVDALGRISSLYQTHPDFKAPGSFIANLRQLIDSSRFEVLRPLQ